MNTSNWTYGAEHELADWDTTKGWEGWDRSDKEVNIMNSNGIAGDPLLRDYHIGSEINSLPTDTIEEQVDVFSKFLKKHKTCTVSHRVGTHIHIRVPGLRDNLRLLKRIQKNIELSRGFLELVDPLPRPTREEYPKEEEFIGAVKNWRVVRKSHHTVIPYHRQEKTKTTEEFFINEIRCFHNGKPIWFTQSRACINLRQLMTTDTIEFRLFGPTLDSKVLYNCFTFSRDALVCLIQEGSLIDLFNRDYKRKTFPRLPRYNHILQKRWEVTNYKHNKRKDIRKIIKLIQNKKYKPLLDWEK